MACDDASDPVKTPADPFPRLPPTRLPVHLARGLPNTYGATYTGTETDLGPDTDQSLYFLNLGPGLRIHSGSLTAVATLPDRVVVAYPSAAGGFDLAWGGVDAPWQTQHLSDMARPDVGAIDAVSSPEEGGVVYVVLRDRFDQRIVLYRWTLGGTITSEEIPRPAKHTPRWYQARCPDLALGRSRAGDLDLVYMQAEADEVRVMHARKSHGAGDWTLAEVTKSYADQADVGCRSSITYGPNDFAELLTLRRTFPGAPEPEAPVPADPSSLPWGMFHGIPPETSTIGYFMGADGLFRRGGPSAHIQGAHAWHKGGFDVDVHPAGYTVSGPNIQPGSPEVTYTIGNLGWDVAKVPTTQYVLDFQDPDREPEFEFDKPGNAQKIFFNECGGVAAAGVTPFLVPTYSLVYTTNAWVTCVAPTRLPLRKPTAAERHVHPVENQRAPVYAHGLRPFDAALCLVNEDELEVCGGAEPFGLNEQETWQDEATTPELISANPPDNSLLPVTAKSVTLTLSRPLTDREEYYLDITEVATGLPRVSTIVHGPTPATFEVELPAPLTAAAPIRVALVPRADTIGWSYIGKRRPVLHYTVEGSPGVDPRAEPESAACAGSRVAGVCELTVTPTATSGGSFALEVDVDVVEHGAPPTITDAQGGVALDVTFTPTAPWEPGYPAQTVGWTADLAKGARYVITFPTGSTDRWGRRLADDELRYAFHTAP